MEASTPYKVQAYAERMTALQECTELSDYFKDVTQHLVKIKTWVTTCLLYHIARHKSIKNTCKYGVGDLHNQNDRIILAHA